MISEEQLEQLNRSFKRIFAFPLSRLTTLEVQNAIKDIFPNKIDTTRALYESLLTGDLNDLLKSGDTNELQTFIDQYTPMVRIAKEVAEAGEFLNTFSCDFLQQGKQVFFVNRMRRVDAQEYHFLTAPETSIRLAHMFIDRLRGLKQNLGTIDLDPRLKEELENIKKDVEIILS